MSLPLKLPISVLVIVVLVAIHVVSAIYAVPITIVDRSGVGARDIPVKIILNSTNFHYWSHVRYSNGSDIFFILPNGTILPHWIEYFNKTKQRAIIWVRVPYIPAGGNITVYMCYGDSTVHRGSGSRVFDVFWSPTEISHNFTIVSSGSGTEVNVTSNGTVIIVRLSGAEHHVNLVFPVKLDPPFVLELYYVKSPDNLGVLWFADNETFTGVAAWIDPETGQYRLYKFDNGYVGDIPPSPVDNYTSGSHVLTVIVPSVNRAIVLIDGRVVINSTSITEPSHSKRLVGIHLGKILGNYIFKMFRAYRYVEPQPVVIVGKEVKPNSSIILNILDIYGKPLSVPVQVILLGMVGLKPVMLNITVNGSAILHVPQGQYYIIAYWWHVPLYWSSLNVSSLLVNVTVKTNMTVINDYRGLRKIIAGIDIYNVWEHAHGAVLNIDVRREFGIVIDYVDVSYLPDKVNITCPTCTYLNYTWNGTKLLVVGNVTGNGTVRIADLYRVTIRVLDMLGREVPCAVLHVNGTVLRGARHVLFLVPGTYNVSVPAAVCGFELRNSSTVTVQVRNRTTLVFRYRTPTTFRDVRYRIVTVNETIAGVYIEGYLKDYFNVAVPGRTILVKIVNASGNTTFTISVVTDRSGHFKTPTIMLTPNRTYLVELSYLGDDIYVESNTTLNMTLQYVATMPEAGKITFPIASIIGVILGITAITITLRVMRHLRKTRKFVKHRPRQATPT